MRRIWKGNAIPSTRKGRIVRSEQRERRTHLPKQMLRPKGAEGCSVSCFGSRKLLNHASIASRILFVLCIALTPQSGDSSGAILEVPFKALLHLPHARNERTLKKRLFEFPRKGLFLDRGENAYTKRAARLCGSFAYTRASVFLVQLLFVPICGQHAQVAAVAPLSVLASGSEELGCLLWVLLSHRSEM